MTMFQLKPRRKATENALQEERDINMSAEQESAFIRANRKTGRHYRVNWANVMIACKLAEKSMMYRSANTRSSDRGNLRRYPKLMSVESSDTTDRLIVLMAHGQHPEDYAKAADRLAHAWQAISCKVFSDNAGHVRLDLQYVDALAQPFGALPIPDQSSLKALPVGITEDGSPWTIRLSGNHLLIGGSTGAGKSGLTWGIVRALFPAMREGLVKLHGIDGKRMELAYGREIFDTFGSYTDDPDDIADKLEQHVEDMQKRAIEFGGKQRSHKPTKEYPLVVILIDEVGYLTHYLPAKKLERGEKQPKDRISTALAALLTQGRAIGYVVIGALQDPRKEVLGIRGLFPTKVALRLDDGPAAVDMMLGTGARDAGAYADQISTATPGVAYVRVEGNPEPVKVRSAWVSDDDIDAMCMIAVAQQGQ